MTGSGKPWQPDSPGAIAGNPPGRQRDRMGRVADRSLDTLDATAQSLVETFPDPPPKKANWAGAFVWGVWTLMVLGAGNAGGGA